MLYFTIFENQREKELIIKTKIGTVTVLHLNREPDQVTQHLRWMLETTIDNCS